jgi:2-dehydropantoate 2-reductase
MITAGERLMSENLTIALIGPGAIGTTIAAALHEVDRAPLLCGRTAHSQLTLRHDEGEIVVPGPVLTEPTSIQQPVDLVFVAVKTTQVAESAGWLAALCDEKTVVCALQNGVEQKAQLAPLVNGATVLPSVVWFPAQREPDSSVWLRAKPRLTLPDVPQAQRVVEALSGTRCAVDLSADFLSIAWRKLLQNAAAGLMVLANRRAGMFSRDDITDLALAYLRECLAVARAEGAVLKDDVPQEIVGNFQRAPADLGTSILADRQANRPLEWDIRNGVIQRLGHAHGIAVPVSDVLVPLLAAASEGPG